MRKVIGLSICAIGIITLLGYSFQNESLYRWSDTPMAINTALAFILTGIGLIVKD